MYFYKVVYVLITLDIRQGPNMKIEFGYVVLGPCWWNFPYRRLFTWKLDCRIVSSRLKSGNGGKLCLIPRWWQSGGHLELTTSLNHLPTYFSLTLFCERIVIWKTYYMRTFIKMTQKLNTTIFFKYFNDIWIMSSRRYTFDWKVQLWLKSSSSMDWTDL